MVKVKPTIRKSGRGHRRNQRCLFFGLIFYWLLFPVIGAAHDPVYRQYTIRDGLPSNVIYSAVQDDQGFMWFGTDAGVVRFDGKKFQQFSVNDGIPDNDILRLFKDSKGRIWFLTLNGKLSFYYKGVIHNSFNDSLVPGKRSEGGFISAQEDEVGGIWFGGLANNMEYLDTNGNYYQSVNDKEWLSQGLGYNIIFCNSHSKGILGNFRHKLYRFVPPLFKRENSQLTNKFDSTYCFINGPDNSIIVVADNKINVIVNDEIKISYPIKNFKMDHSTRMSVEPDGSVWLHNNFLQTRYFRRTPTTFSEGGIYLSGCHMSQVFVDSEGSRWFCTNGKGVFQMSKNEVFFENIQPNSSGSSNAIHSIIGDDFGGIIFSDESGTIYRKSNAGLQALRLHKKTELVSRVLDFLFINSNELLCASDLGLFWVGVSSKGLSDPIFITDRVQRKPVSFKSLAKNKESIFAANRNVIFKVSKDLISEKYFIENLVFKAGRTYAMEGDGSNRIWFEQFERLNYLYEDKIKAYPDLDTLFTGKITDIKFLDNGKMAISTYGKGVRILNNDKLIQTINKKNGLCSDYCNEVYIKDNEWFVATAAGLSIIKWSTANNYSITSYYQNDGLLSSFINNVFADERCIYMATPMGLCVLNRSIALRSSPPPSVSILSFEINGKNTDMTKNISVPFNSNDISIKYVAPTYVAPEKTIYEYRIGPNNDWKQTSQEVLEFNSLPAGDYVFQVRAQLYNSDWSLPVEIPFQVLPPFYDTSWFKLSIGSLLLIILYFLFQRFTARKYRRQLRQLEQQQMIEAERRRISADMHDDFGADLTQIVLLSRLAKNKSDRFEVIHQIETASLDVITKMNEIIWALNPVNDTLPHLASYLRRLSNEFSDASQILVEFTTNGELPEIPLTAALRRNLFLIFKEAIRNITKHAGASRVEVLFNYHLADRCIRMGIKDDGKGFNSDAKSEYGNGLLNMRKRAEEINAQLNFVPTDSGGTHIEIIVSLNF